MDNNKFISSNLWYVITSYSIQYTKLYDKGTTRQLQADGKRKQVRIPQGVRTGSKVRVAGAGPNGMDLYLIVQVRNNFV